MKNNAKIIKNMLKTKKFKGYYKNYVIVTADKIFDWNHTYYIDNQLCKDLVGDKIILLHKSELHRIVGCNIALQFWKCGLRMRPINDCFK